MLRKIWTVLGVLTVFSAVYITVFAAEDVQTRAMTDDLSRGAAEPATWTVCSDGCDFSSIQAAVDSASGGDTLSLGAETFYENITIEKDLVLQGAGRGLTIIDGMRRATAVRILGASDTTRPSDVTLADMTIRRGYAEGAGGGIAVGRDSRIVVEQCEITDNDADYAGGGISAYFADIAIADSVIHRNDSFTWGGGIYISGGSLTVRHSTLSENYGAFGGGIYAYPTSPGTDVEIVNSTITRNYEGFMGGGIVCESAGGRWTISDSTITGNEGGGLVGYTSLEACRAEMTVRNSIISGNSRGDCIDLYSAQSAGHNLTSDTTCGFSEAGDIAGVDPLLEPLADNGGLTPTHALAPDSSAIDAGGDDCSSMDQRGFDRPQDGDGDGVSKCDIGAFEYESPVVTIQIDIKPDGHPNSINPYSRGVIPIAILGSDTFDASDIDLTTLVFGPGGAPIAHMNGHLQDVNLDSFTDLVTHFRTRDTGIVCGDDSATLTGETLDGQPIEGTDSINTVGCRASRWPAIWMKDEEREAQTREGEVIDLERKR
jgi:hypothetical protein